ncbi:hypothetical protein TorRG33x02_132600 [Trema orientale]|uniref:Uncharacterized protein n=1 Tax=Trema orientale TaxID=63057 RepID=A0A2P5EZ90_TREOI|nr:hypothetical protein TorRG33x02_132600 [Trema orientale]
MERVLGRHSVRLGGWERSLSGSTATSEMDLAEPHRPTYAELVQELSFTHEQLQDLVEGLNECRQVLREHNLMPPPRTRPSISDRSSGPGTSPPRAHVSPLSDGRDESPSLHTSEQNDS